LPIGTTADPSQTVEGFVDSIDISTPVRAVTERCALQVINVIHGADSAIGCKRRSEKDLLCVTSGQIIPKPRMATTAMEIDFGLKFISCS